MTFDKHAKASSGADGPAVSTAKKAAGLAFPASLHPFGRELTVLSCVGGIYSFYMLYAVLQERIMCTPYGDEGDIFDDSFVLLLVQCTFNALAASLVLLVTGQVHTGPTVGRPVVYAMMSSSYLGGMLASYAALAYINFPTAVLAKSCKMIPVMIIGTMFGKRYGLRNWVSMLAVAGGIAMFNYLKPAKAGSEDSSSSILGLVLVMTSLACDGLTGALQDYQRQYFQPSTHQLMFNVNLFATLLLIPGVLFSGGLWVSLEFFTKHPEIVGEILTFSVVSALGQNFIFLTVTQLGSLACSLITTTRKFFTILASVILFRHPLLSGQWAAVAVVFASLGYDVWLKYQKTPTDKAKKSE